MRRSTPRPLTREEVKTVRRLHREGWEVRNISAALGCGKQCVRDILNGKTHSKDFGPIPPAFPPG